jgi:hypothetical protein
MPRPIARCCQTLAPFVGKGAEHRREGAAARPVLARRGGGGGSVGRRARVRRWGRLRLAPTDYGRRRRIARGLTPGDDDRGGEEVGGDQRRRGEGQRGAGRLRISPGGASLAPRRRRHLRRRALAKRDRGSAGHLARRILGRRQRRRERARGGEAVVGVLGGGALDRRCQPGRLVPHPVRRGEGLIDVAPHLLHLVAGERGGAGECLVEHAAERVDVGASIDLAALNLLRRDAVDRSDPLTGAGQLGRGRASLSEPEVGQVALAGARRAFEQDVCRLDVAVDHAGGVGGVQAAATSLTILVATPIASGPSSRSTARRSLPST